MNYKPRQLDADALALYIKRIREECNLPTLVNSIGGHIAYLEAQLATVTKERDEARALLDDAVGFLKRARTALKDYGVPDHRLREMFSDLIEFHEGTDAARKEQG